MAHILVIDDDTQILKMLRQILEREKYHVTEASNGKEGLRLYRENPADLVITGINPEDYLDIAKKLGANRIFAKPVERKELLNAVRELLVP